MHPPTPVIMALLTSSIFTLCTIVWLGACNQASLFQYVHKLFETNIAHDYLWFWYNSIGLCHTSFAKWFSLGVWTSCWYSHNPLIVVNYAVFDILLNSSLFRVLFFSFCSRHGRVTIYLFGHVTCSSTPIHHPSKPNS